MMRDGQPASRRNQRFADEILVHAVWSKNPVVLAVTIGKMQINFIVKVVFPRSGESHIHPRQQCGQGISLQEKAVLHTGVMTRIADRSRLERSAIHLFEKEVKERFIGRT